MLLPDSMWTLKSYADALCLRILLQGQIPCLLCGLLPLLWTEAYRCTVLQKQTSEGMHASSLAWPVYTPVRSAQAYVAYAYPGKRWNSHCRAIFKPCCCLACCREQPHRGVPTPISICLSNAVPLSLSVHSGHGW